MDGGGATVTSGMGNEDTGMGHQQTYRKSSACSSLTQLEMYMDRYWDVWGELVPSKIFNPPFPVLKAEHSVSYSYIQCM